jgi:phosphoribosylglycinamide formyltransferase 1
LIAGILTIEKKKNTNIKLKLHLHKGEGCMENGKIRTALVASGSGTDADAIMRAYAIGAIPNIDLAGLISTKEGVSCLEKVSAVNREFGLTIDAIVISRKMFGERGFNDRLSEYLRTQNVELIFSVGCVVKIYVGAGTTGRKYNIHPADPDRFGGKGLYGLEPHRRVMADIKDQIDRGKMEPYDRFFTFPTVHEVVPEYDSGEQLLQAKVEIPTWLVGELMAGGNIDSVAEKLQKYVLPYEWAILPAAVKIAAQRILDEKAQRCKE